MAKIILPTRTVDAVFADVSIPTGRFNALLLTDMDTAEIVEAFSGIEHFTVINDGLPEKAFDGFTIFDSMMTRDDGILIRLRKEG